MVSAHAYPTFELSDAVPLLAKTAAKERKLGPCPEIPYCPEIPSLHTAAHCFSGMGVQQLDLKQMETSMETSLLVQTMPVQLPVKTPLSAAGIM